MGRPLWIVGLLAFVATAAAAWTGATLAGDEGVRPHLLLGLGAALAALFAHAWTAIYLAATARVVRSSTAGRELAGQPGAEARRIALRTVPWAAAAAVLPAAALFSGNAVYAESTVFTSLPKTLHTSLSWAAVAVQAVALAIEWPVLGRHEALVRRVDRALG